MTRKEIEERCRKEMQQSIQDKEALWQRIEQQLPDRQSAASEPQKAPLRMTVLRRVMTAAACFLFVAAGISVFIRSDSLKTMEENTVGDPMENTAESVMEENPGNLQENEGEQEDYRPEYATEPSADVLSYESLQFARTDQTVSVLDRDQLGTEGEYFSEAAVLERTECFVDVKVQSGSQNPESGIMTYTLEVVDVYGTDVLAKDTTLTLQTYSAYLLEAGHEYLLPLYMEERSWKLSYECAPQLELTLDGSAVYHSGWQSLRREADPSLRYERYGTDDYFYDRMHLGDAGVLLSFVEHWAASV